MRYCRKYPNAGAKKRWAQTSGSTSETLRGFNYAEPYGAPNFAESYGTPNSKEPYGAPISWDLTGSHPLVSGQGLFFNMVTFLFGRLYQLQNPAADVVLQAFGLFFKDIL